MPGSYFTRTAETSDTGRYLAGSHTAGPWAEHLQHGGPPNALAVVAAERAMRAATGRDDLLAMRLAADFVGPVPVGEVETRAQVLRAARSAALVEVVITAQDRDCLRARVWFVRVADTSGASTDDGVVVPALPAERGVLGMEFGYGASIDWRFTSGSFTEPGPAGVWAAPTVALISDDGDAAADPAGGFGTGTSGLARVALVADSASGVSSELDWARWSFPNVDLDIHLARPMAGSWVHMQARTTVGPFGTALAHSTLSDRDGPVGAGLQTLVVSPMPTR
ncbi:thioesterase family protein [uncultured Jatrophihabitans sp.]|uniref:thioesterase family protein n=1 Tax=uncultured Jatrophihabitans sp. TaxID=1610747 RepID=UPI0035CB0599